MRKKRILLGASYSVIEPLGLLHLGGLARDEGWDRKYFLVKDHNYVDFFKTVDEYKPDVVGFNVYTGNHIPLREAFEKLKKDNPQVATVVGGPHPTYFPQESSQIADFVVMSEGFGALKRILQGKLSKGIHPMSSVERFPHPDRKTFYLEYPEHAKSKIKSFITMTGCPYKCTYCYNSSEPGDIAAPPEIIQRVKDNLSLSVLGASSNNIFGEGHHKSAQRRLFPLNIRSVDDVMKESAEIAQNWSTQVLYCQDDVHGFDLTDWMPKFAQRWSSEVGIPYHAQMRWEMTKDERRLDLLKKAGCFGLTLAIEAADYHIRHEVLDRAMPEETMINGTKALKDRAFRFRTEQITALPYGATKERTDTNLDADIGLIKLNLKLQPDIAWASTLAPYKGTKLGQYCEKFGFYKGDNSDVPDTFFERSVLRFVKDWVGPKLEQLKNDASVWLSPDDLETYREQNRELRRHFNFFCCVPQGDKLASSYLKSVQPFSYDRLGRETESHLITLADQGDIKAKALLQNIASLRQDSGRIVQKASAGLDVHLNGEIPSLMPYFGALPKSALAVSRAIRYSAGKGLTPNVLSTAIRHHLYEEVLYHTGKSSEEDRLIVNERYPAKT